MSESSAAMQPLPVEQGQADELAGRAYLRYALTLLVLVSVFNAIDRSILVALLEPIKDELQLSDLQLGLISGVAFSVFYATLGIPFARWADLGSRPKLLSFTVGLWSLMTALAAGAQNFIQLFLTRVGVGIGEAGGNPAALSLLSELFRIRKGGVATALFLVGASIGGVVGMWGGAALASVWGWRVAFLVMGIPGIFLAVLIRFTLRETRQHCRLPSFSEAFGKDLLLTAKTLLVRPSFFHCIVGFTVFGLFGQGSSQWSISYLVRTFELPLDEIAGIFSIAVGGATIIGTLLGGYVANFIGARSARGYLLFPCAIILLNVPIYILVYTLNSVYLVVAMSALSGLFLGLMTPCIFACIFGICGAEHRAMGLALLGMFSALIGGGVGPLLIGGLSDLIYPFFEQHSLRMALLMSVVFLPLSVVFFFRASLTLAADFHDPADH
ncbi:MAG: MFS transporter [Haliea sp.]|uniref:spinster family MFS transporter n=1 Tax=Haliea sp. TaxID=1932666 RepID=UPI0032EDB841